jgi:hypothetical protein
MTVTYSMVALGPDRTRTNFLLVRPCSGRGGCPDSLCGAYLYRTVFVLLSSPVGDQTENPEQKHA